MDPLASTLTSQVQEFVRFRRAAEPYGFTLGSNWDYDHGSFDCALDDRNQVWLRLPFEVTIGHIDSETEDLDAKIRFGEPYVLKHIYNEGSDREAQPGTFGAVFNQFSDPVNADAAVDPQWMEEAKRKLKPIEEMYASP